MDAGRSAAALFLLSVVFAVFAGAAAAATPSHPLSQISPTDSSLNMSDNAGATSYNITNLGWLNPYGNTVVVGGGLDLRSTSIANYFGSACPSGEAVQDVNNDGTFTCISLSSTVQDDFVDESGDTMTGTLNMSWNNISDLGPAGISISGGGDIDMEGRAIVDLADPTVSSEALTLGKGDTRYLQRAGDSMSGNLDMVDHNISNVARLTNYYDGSCGEGKAVKDMFPNGTVNCGDAGAGLPSTLEINNSAHKYDIDMEGQNISDLPDPILNSQAMTLGFTNSQYVQLSGDVMTGNLDMDANEITNVDRIGNGSSPMRLASPVHISSDDNITTTADGNLSIGTSVKVYGKIWVPGGSGAGGGALAAENLSQTLEAGNEAFKYDIDMSGQNITDLPDPILNSQAMTLGYANSEYVQLSGDVMKGDLDVNGYALKNVDWLGNGTARTITMDTNGNVEIPNGNLDISSPGTTGRALDVGGDTNLGGTLDLNNNNIREINDVKWNDGSGNTISALMSNSDRLDFVNRSGGNQDILRLDRMSGNLNIPNGDLTVSGQLTVGSTECASGEAILGDGTCGATANPQNLSHVLTKGSEANQSIAMANSNLTNVGLGGITIADAQGDLDMANNRIEGLQSHNSGDDAVRKDWIGGNFVDESGDVLTGNLDLDANELKNVDKIGNGSSYVELGSDLLVSGQDLVNVSTITGVEDANVTQTFSTDSTSDFDAGTYTEQTTATNGKLKPSL